MEATLARLRVEVRDPYGARTAIAAHPYVAAGIATAVGVVLARLFTSRTSERPDAPTRLAHWAGRLLDGALALLLPLGKAWLSRQHGAVASRAEAPSAPVTAAGGGDAPSAA